MTITSAKKLSDFSGFLNKEMAGPVFDKAAQMSAVMQLAQQVPLGLVGTDIPVFTSDPTADWVSEAGVKHRTEGAMALKTMSPKKLTAIHVESQEVVRANPGGYVTRMRNKIAEAFAKSFDAAALHGKSLATGGAGPFATSISDTTKSQELGGRPAEEGGIYQDFVDGLAELTDDDKELDGFVLSPRTEPKLLGAVDVNGHPILVDLPASAETGRRTRLLGRPVAWSKSVHQAVEGVAAIGGDWSQAAWGVLGGISYRTTTEGTVTVNGSPQSMFETNCVAFLMEAEYGFVVNDPDAFILYTDSLGS